MSFSADQLSKLESLITDTNGWTLSTESADAKLYTQQGLNHFISNSKSPSLDMVKLVAHVPYHVDEIHAITRDVEIRKLVSPLVSHVELLEQHDNGDILYQRVTPPIPLMSARTMLIERKFSVHKTPQHDSSSYHWYMKSLDTHHKLPKGDQGAVRCTIHVQALRIEPHPTLPKNAILTVVNQYVCTSFLFVMFF